MRGTKIAAAHHIGGEPYHQRHQQAPVGGREDHGRADPLHGGVPDGIDHLHHRIAQRRRGLHDLVGDAAGEVVLEEAQALAQHVAVRQPAHAVGHRPGDDLVLDQVVGRGNMGLATTATNAIHSRIAAMVAMKIWRRLGGLHHVDEAADEGHQRHLDERAEEARHQQHREGGPDRLDEVARRTPTASPAAAPAARPGKPRCGSRTSGTLPSPQIRCHVPDRARRSGRASDERRLRQQLEMSGCARRESGRWTDERPGERGRGRPSAVENGDDVGHGGGPARCCSVSGAPLSTAGDGAPARVACAWQHTVQLC